MLKTTIAAALAAGVLMAGGFCNRAGAQVIGTAETILHPTSIKIGGFFPSNGNASHNGGSPQLSAGLDYAIVKSSNINPTEVSAYFDYEGGSRNGGHVDAYGLGGAARVYAALPGTSHSGVPYLGAGIGAYDISTKNGSTGKSSSKINLGGKIFAGEELAGGLFVEANYQVLPGSNGINPSGFGLQVGMRF